MDILVFAFVFLLGLCFGSFINALVYRSLTKKSILGRSACPNCKHQLSWYDNVPLVSWLFLSGKCRYCKKNISIQYPLVEIVTGIMFLTIYFYSEAGKVVHSGLIEFSLPSLSEIIVLKTVTFTFLALMAISVYDYKTKEIPDAYNFVFAILSLMYLAANTNFRVGLMWPNILSAIVAFLFFYSFVYISKETWMGGGDAKLAIGIGLLLGPSNTFLAILLASWLGAIYGVGQIFLTKNKKNRISLNSEIPFGPFLAFGCYISFLFGSQIVAWYAKIFLGF